MKGPEDDEGLAVKVASASWSGRYSSPIPLNIRLGPAAMMSM